MCSIHGGSKLELCPGVIYIAHTGALTSIHNLVLWYTQYSSTNLCITGLVHLKRCILPKFNVKSPTFVVVLTICPLKCWTNMQPGVREFPWARFWIQEWVLKKLFLFQFKHVYIDDMYCISIMCISDMYRFALDSQYKALSNTGEFYRKQHIHY